MSLTSYRAAPPRVNRICSRKPGHLLGASGFAFRCGLFTPRQVASTKTGDEWNIEAWLDWPGSDLLFHVLGRSTIGAEGFHGRVRDGIGC